MWWRILVGTILGVGVAATSVHAQSDPAAPGAAGGPAGLPLSIPVGAQLLEVRWSGDRLGEATIVTTLPAAFRRAEGHSGPSAGEGAAARLPVTPPPAPALR